MDLKNPCCIYCKKSLSLEFVLENNDTNWCKTIFIPFFENLCLEKEKSYLIDTMPKYKKMVEIREIKIQSRDRGGISLLLAMKLQFPVAS